METAKNNDKPILPVLRTMSIGESATYPLKRRSYVCSACVRFGQEWDKKFETRTDRETRTITVTRTA